MQTGPSVHYCRLLLAATDSDGVHGHGHHRLVYRSPPGELAGLITRSRTLHTILASVLRMRIGSRSSESDNQPTKGHPMHWDGGLVDRLRNEELRNEAVMLRR